jgi:transcriptional regulator with XRE-family HTH domain
MAYDYSKLLGKIRECGYTQESLSQAIKMSASTLNLKLNNNASFKQSEIKKICKVLGISEDEIGIYFFAEKV